MYHRNDAKIKLVLANFNPYYFHTKFDILRYETIGGLLLNQFRTMVVTIDGGSGRYKENLSIDITKDAGNRLRASWTMLEMPKAACRERAQCGTQKLNDERAQQQEIQQDHDCGGHVLPTPADD
ncbi:hypothetical protein BDB00DRAFT_792564 [Zychaea mexicana]|uniref:uncharacterized protein n=1 Tax=Zychaea mexicana TaxID=64656 RepID=UPI0022FE27E5|nr:uncharacterized protein BDB00DRAFT_792564 [Zychaea mexicana]KAI9484835.1 hypothetical protein BDB00DRAFT_792564 [Zychaea mexicana]